MSCEFKIEHLILTHADIPMLRTQFYCSFQTLRDERERKEREREQRQGEERKIKLGHIGMNTT